MADEKGGSDLDVFEGLAKKTRPTAPGLAPPPSAQPFPRASGGASIPLPPPPTGGLGPLPPPSMPKQSTPLVPPPASGSGRPLPPPAPPPSAVPTSGALPPPVAPPAPLPPPAPPPGMPASQTLVSAVAPLPPPMAPPTAEKKEGGMEWDEDESATHVFAGAPGELPPPTGPRPAAGAPALGGSAAALLASSGGQAAAPPIAPPAPSPAPLPMAMPPPAARSPRVPAVEDGRRVARAEESTVVRQAPVQAAGGSKMGVILGVISLLVVLGLAAFLLIPRKGQLKIDAKTATGGPIAKAEVYVDGNKKCDTVPCVVPDLEPGAKSIKIIAPDFAPLEQTEMIEAGQEKVVVIPLVGGAATASQPAAVTALKIGGDQKGVKVFVDNIDKGGLPLDLTDITPGTHKVRLEGGDRYEKMEQTVEVAAGQTKDIGTVKLKVLKGQVTFELATDGADVKLIKEEGAKKTEKKLPADLWKKPPVQVEFNPSERWKLIATKKGMPDFTQEIAFDDGQAEKTIRIDLSGKSQPEPIAASSPEQSGTIPSTPSTSTGGGKPTGTVAPPSTGPDKPPPATAGGNGTLNINSIPVSKVVLDGRPLGSTPKVGVSVPAGSHTVVFIHSELGKKSVTVQVKAGETKTAAVKFK